MIWFWVVVLVLVIGAVAVVAAGRDNSMAGAYEDRPDRAIPAGRALTADDLQKVRFTSALRGYRMDEVDALIDRLAADLIAREQFTEAAETAETSEAAETAETSESAQPPQSSERAGAPTSADDSAPTVGASDVEPSHTPPEVGYPWDDVAHGDTAEALETDDADKDSRVSGTSGDDVDGEPGRRSRSATS